MMSMAEDSVDHGSVWWIILVNCFLLKDGDLVDVDWDVSQGVHGVSLS